MLKLITVGSLPKRLKGPVLKTGRGRKARESSNLSASAIFFEITPIINLIYQSLQKEGPSACLDLINRSKDIQYVCMNNNLMFVVDFAL